MLRCEASEAGVVFLAESVDVAASELARGAEHRASSSVRRGIIFMMIIVYRDLGFIKGT